MLPFDRKPWAKQVAWTVIVLTVIGALIAPFYLHHIRHLDPPMAVLVILLVLAIVPPNIVIVRRHDHGDFDPPANSDHRPGTAYASRSIR